MPGQDLEAVKVKGVWKSPLCLGFGFSGGVGIGCSGPCPRRLLSLWPVPSKLCDLGQTMPSSLGP